MFGWLGYGEMGTVKAVVAGAGAALLVLRILVPRWETRPIGWRRGWDTALLLLGTLAAACWWNLFQFNFPGFGHPSETYHYYIGAKYFPELGYTRLYRCTALADAAAGRRDDVATRQLRNLETNELEPAAAALEEPERCTGHFTPERWAAFQRDVAWFREGLSKRRWHITQTDHGYNGTPVWRLFGSLLAHTGPASDGQILLLRLVDVLLLAVAGGAVAWTFGWRTLCVALLFWGTNYPAQYGWVGGSYLRQLEVCAALLALCLMRRRRNLAAGFLLGLAGLVRIYPLLLFAGPALGALAEMARRRRLWLAPQHGRLLLGGLLAAATLLPLSALSSGGFAAWGGFVENSRVLASTPLRNHLGLATLLAYDPAQRSSVTRDPSLDDPFAVWKRAREETFERRRGLFVAALAGSALLLGAAVRRQPDWVATVLAAGLVPVATELTCYYSVVLVAFALLWQRHPPVAVALCALSALGWVLADRFLFYDEIFSWISLATVGFVAFAWVWVWRRAPAASIP